MEKSAVIKARETLIGSLPKELVNMKISCSSSRTIDTGKDVTLHWDDANELLLAFRFNDYSTYDKNSMYDVTVMPYSSIETIDLYCNEHSFRRIANNFGLPAESIEDINKFIDRISMVKQNGWIDGTANPQKDNN